MSLMRCLEWGGAVSGVAGTLLLALNLGLGAVAFGCYAISNALWLIYSYATQQKGMLMMNGVYSITTVIGLINYQ